MKNIIKNLISGSKKDCARIISMVENRSSGYEKILSDIIPYTGKSYIIGITGPPGVGKSTFTKEMVQRIAKDEVKVGIIAIDPTSYFTKGAILGDRIRMNQLNSNENVFIRSMASRGSLGGTTNSILPVIKVLEAYGCDYIFIETVGVGQSEIDIVNISDTVIILLMPGMGDEIQAIKAGIMEIGDIFVINKADKDGVNRTKIEIENMINFKQDWEFKPKINLTIANQGKGIDEVIENLYNHREYLMQSKNINYKKINRCKKELNDFVHMKLEEIINNVYIEENIEQFMKENIENNIDAYKLSEDIVNKIMKK